MQNVLILVSCASVWQTEARLTILWRNCSFKLCYEMVSCASVWQTEARLSHLDVFGGFLTGWNRLKQYGCASAQTIVFFMEGAPSTLHTILRGRGPILVNGLYWGSNPFTDLLLTSWDIQVVFQIPCEDPGRLGPRECLEILARPKKEATR